MIASFLLLQTNPGVLGVKAVVSNHFGYGSGRVRGPLKPLAESNFQGNKYYDTLASLIEEEKKL